MVRERELLDQHDLQGVGRVADVLQQFLVVRVVGGGFQLSARANLADSWDERRRWTFFRNPKPREASIRKEPEIAVPVTQRRPYIALRQAILLGIVQNRAGAWFNPVHTPRCTGVHAAQAVFG